MVPASVVETAALVSTTSVVSAGALVVSTASVVSAAGLVVSTAPQPHPRTHTLGNIFDHLFQVNTHHRSKFWK